MCDHVCDSVRYLWLHCITWIVTVRSPGQQLSLNGQSQLKLGYWRPRAEQPGHQESKIKQPPLLPPKNRPPSAAGNQVNVLTEGKKNFRSIFNPRFVTCLDLILSDRFSWWCDFFFSTLQNGIKGGSLEVIVWPLRAKSMTLLLQGTTRLHSLSRHLRRVRLFTPLTSPADIQTITFSVVNEQVHDASWTCGKKPEGRSRRTERRTVTAFRAPPSKIKIWPVPFQLLQTVLKHSFLYLLFNYRLSHPSRVTVVGDLDGLVNTAWVCSNICSGYSQKVTFLSSWTRLPPESNGFWMW